MAAIAKMPAMAAPARSLPYADGPRRTLDVYRPRRADGAPVVVFFYGGSWQGGRKETYRFVGRSLARRGIIANVEGQDARLRTLLAIRGDDLPLGQRRANVLDDDADLILTDESERRHEERQQHDHPRK